MKTRILPAISLIVFLAATLPAMADSALSVETNNAIHDYQDAMTQQEAADEQVVKTETNAIQQRLKSDREDLNAYVGFGGANGIYPWNSCNSHDYMVELTKNAERETKQVKQDAVQTERDQEQLAQQREQIVADEAQNLQAIENENPKAPGVHIDAQSSDLYVQNYR